MIYSFLNGTEHSDFENVDFQFTSGFSKAPYFYAYRKENILYVRGIITYNGILSSGITKILDFDLGSSITGASAYAFYLPCLYYATGATLNGTVQFIGGELRTGRPTDYSKFGNPYLYINGATPIGLNGLD